PFLGVSSRGAARRSRGGNHGIESCCAPPVRALCAWDRGRAHDGTRARGRPGERLLVGWVSFAVYAGELYAGGFFTTADGGPAAHVARWDGAQWHAVGAGLNNSVNALV